MATTPPAAFQGLRGRARSGRIPTAAVARLAVAALLLLTLTPAPPARAAHGGFPVSTATYRIPYADGTQLAVTRDHHNHAPNQDRIDMVASPPPPPAATVVAAASGTVMAIVDIHGNTNGNGDGLDVNRQSGQLLADGATVHTDALEHSCQDATEDANGNNVLDPGEDLNGDGVLNTSIPNTAVIGLCQNYNNYVWIRHPNGEWSKYTHMATGSVTGAPGNLSVGDTVLVGQPLGLEADIGRAGGRHLHHEVAAPNNPADDTPFGAGSFVFATIPGGGNAPPPGTTPPPGGPTTGYYAGGFIQGTNLVPFVCDIAGNLYADNTTSPGNNTFTANPCTNTAPTAVAGGPYSVAEGSTVQLDGTASSDPENAILTFSWSPGTNLDDPTSPTPVYSGVDDTVEVIQLTVSDVGGDVTPATALTDSDGTTVTVTNVAPEVSAVGDSIDEGGTATVSATFTDPGALDTHTAFVDWDDSTPVEEVTVVELAAGVDHVYGDNGLYSAVVTVVDDDGGTGSDAAVVTVGNLDPTVTLEVPGTITFPGGDYAVVEAGADLPASAQGTDPGSDDLTFTWSVGDVSTYHNDPNGVPDPFPSPLGTFPFAAADAIDAGYASPGAQVLSVTLIDDDGGTDSADGGVVVTGTAARTEGSGWWKQQFSGAGQQHIDADIAAGYLEVVDAVSSVFSESIVAATAGDVHAILSPPGGDRRARAASALMTAWLHFASGGVAWDDAVPLGGGSSVGFLDLMFAAEGTILDPGASDEALLSVEHDLNSTRHAS